MNVQSRASLVTALTLGATVAACGRAALELPPVPASVHEHKPPHGGALVELGDEAAHVEFLLDSKRGELTAYVLDGEAENPVRLAQREIVVRFSALNRPTGETSVIADGQELHLTAVTNVLTGEIESDSSQFAASSDALKGVSGFRGTLTALTIRGATFAPVSFRYPEGNEHD
jgi:hypothetical protein